MTNRSRARPPAGTRRPADGRGAFVAVLHDGSRLRLSRTYRNRLLG